MNLSECITINTLLKVYDIEPALLYNQTIEAIDLEESRLEIHESNHDHNSCVQSRMKIMQSKRLLSVIRIDALDGYRRGLWQESVN